MQRHSYKICFALTALALAVLGLNGQDTGSQEVPYRGTFKLVFNGFSADPPIVTGTYTFSGQATHLGKSTGEGSFKKDLMTGVVTSNKCTVTGANGDQIFCAVSYKLVATDTPNLFTLELTFKFTGGTGGFEGVTGSGKGTGSFDVSTNQGSFTLTGTGQRAPKM